ncbi:hypothetical protein CI610_03177 [invertebrate metagenome]|uniref:Uncharacterized protein n=1 Tax=invertebrate metagenome TaxID=1711999 RepID=A0A2H9T3S7_9ZZZZ
MPLTLPTQPRFGVNRFQSRLSHKAADFFPVEAVPLITEERAHSS